MTRLIGITTTADGTPIRRVPKLLKIGIGIPRGPAIHCWLQKSEDGTKVQWVFRGGKKDDKNKLIWTISKRRIDVVDEHGNSNRAAAEAYYRECLTQVAEASYPQKISYFTFTKSSVGPNGKEVFEPDFEAIEKHGPMPTSINILFVTDDPFDGEYAMWSTSELKCHGDGVNAMRVLAMASTPEEKELAKRAKEAGEKYFPIVKGCATLGCPYYAEQGGKAAACKPSATLRFQLLGDIRIGGTSYFQTTGIRSISWINESLMQIRELLQMMGRDLQGVPLRMSLKPYRTNHNGQAATQYGVWLELRAQDIPTLVKKLDEAGSAFRRVAPASRQIEAPATDTGADEDEDDIPQSAQAMSAEFFPDAEDDVVEDTPAAKTAEKVEEVKAGLSAQAADQQEAGPKFYAPSPSVGVITNLAPSGSPKPSPMDAVKDKLKAETAPAAPPSVAQAFGPSASAPKAEKEYLF